MRSAMVYCKKPVPEGRFGPFDLNFRRGWFRSMSSCLSQRAPFAAPLVILWLPCLDNSISTKPLLLPVLLSGRILAMRQNVSIQ